MDVPRLLAQRPTTPALTKPLTRGWSHVLAFLISLWLAVKLGLAASPSYLATCLAFVSGVSAMFGISALYHVRHWPRRQRVWVGRVDQSAIFVCVLGTYAPFIHALGSHMEARLLPLALAGAVIGSLITLFWPNAPKPVASALYVLYGSMVVGFLPDLERAVGPAVVAWLAAGGIAYALGAAVFAFRRPNPWPTVFGYHEIFHALVITGAACHYEAVGRIVSG